MIVESGLELNELDSTSWSSSEAGRRVYPRIKRYVQQAWKQLQMARNQWEFNTAQVSEVVYPRFKYEGGDGLAVPSSGDVFVGQESGFELTVRRVITDSGEWTDGDAVGQIEFGAYNHTNKIVPGEVFVLEGGTDSFVYLRTGSYNFGLDVANLAEIQWSTFVINVGNSAPIPGLFIPYANWMYEAYSYASGGISPPAYVSQDFEGNVVFLQQSYEPFRVSFIYAVQPQILTNYDDIPQRMPEAYHEWIAWEALKRLATYDKNPQLYAHAERNTQFFRNRAETNLMPFMSWAGSRFDE